MCTVAKCKVYNVNKVSRFFRQMIILEVFNEIFGSEKFSKNTEFLKSVTPKKVRQNE